MVARTGAYPAKHYTPRTMVARAPYHAKHYSTKDNGSWDRRPRQLNTYYTPKTMVARTGALSC